MLPRLPQRRQGLADFWWPVFLAGAIFIESSLPVPDVPLPFPQFDKVVHFFLFWLLATVFIRLDWPGPRRGHSAVVTVALVSLYGASDELHQHFTPGRTMDGWDWAADTAGALGAATLYAGWRSYRHFLERKFGRKRRVEFDAEESLNRS